VAMPGGDPVTLVPRAVGQFALVDKSHEFALAQVFVLRYATFAVTGVDGKFEIDRIPTGKKVQVSAYSPSIGQTVQQEVTVPPGGAIDVQLEIPYEAKNEKDGAAPR